MIFGSEAWREGEKEQEGKMLIQKPQNGISRTYLLWPPEY
jgi:hypothetical protein